MNASAGPGLAAQDLAELPERIQLEVQRASQRSIKGVEYSWLSTPQQHAINIQEQDRSNVRPKTGLRHPTALSVAIDLDCFDRYVFEEAGTACVAAFGAQCRL